MNRNYINNDKLLVYKTTIIFDDNLKKKIFKTMFKYRWILLYNTLEK